MSFSKDKIPEHKKHQADLMWPKLKELGLERSEGSYYHSFFHRDSGVSVDLSPIKEKNSYGFIAGFKMKIARRDHPHHGRDTVLVGIDNYDAVKKAIADSIKYVKERDKAEVDRKNFKKAFTERLQKLFPGKDVNVSEGRGDFTGTVRNKDYQGTSIQVKLYRDNWEVIEVTASYSKKSLEDVAKIMKAEFF